MGKMEKISSSILILWINRELMTLGVIWKGLGLAMKPR